MLRESTAKHMQNLPGQQHITHCPGMNYKNPSSTYTLLFATRHSLSEIGASARAKSSGVLMF